MNILFYFPHDPLPPTSGAHHRAIQIVRGLVRRGDDVHFVSSDCHADKGWDNRGIERLRALGCRSVSIHEVSKVDRLRKLLKSGVLRASGRWDAFVNAIDVPAGLVNWFQRLVAENKPDLVILSYCWFGSLLAHGVSCRAAVDMHGLFSLNQVMEEWLRRELRLFREGKRYSPLLFADNLERSIRPRVSSHEVLLYDRFDQVITLSKKETDILRDVMPHKQLTYIPLTYEVQKGRGNTRGGHPVTIVGPNQFNEHGLELFGQRVLPVVQASACHDFELDVIGRAALACKRYEKTNYLGYVDDLSRPYSAAPFLVCTTALGTGQQVKVVEAMAHGLPVVAYKSAAEGTLIAHTENGLVADSIEEFALLTMELNKDRARCVRLGERAMATVADECQFYAQLPGI